jgi:hypothetical protein
VDLRQTFVFANAFKEGDRLVGGLDDERMRAEARRAVEALRLGAITLKVPAGVLVPCIGSKRMELTLLSIVILSAADRATVFKCRRPQV